MVSYLTRVPSGVAGDITRQDDTIVEAGLLNAAKAPTKFGLPVKIVAGKFEAIEANDTVANFYGIIARTAPTIAGDTTQTFNSGLPNTTAVHGIVKKGYVNVVCPVGTPVRGDKVFMRTVADTGKLVGDLEATTDVTATGSAITGTGNGTIGTLSATQDAETGVYRVTMLTATTFRVETPSGIQLRNGATGAAYTAGGLTFTVTVGGTPMIAGDFFNVTVAKRNVALPNVFWAVGGKDSNNVSEIVIS